MSLDTVRDWQHAARHIAVLTGAGVSAESGVPTFREAQTGLWSQFRPEELATEAAFRDNPARVWDWYSWRRQIVAQVAPNAAHRALADFAQHHPGRLRLITQNVDGLHQQAGSREVLALHGNLFENRWLDPAQACCDATRAEAGSPPFCSGCGNRLRPGVVWFGEALPAQVLAAAEQAARQAELMLVVGTSGVVYPAAGLVRLTPGRVVVINPAPTALDVAADVVLRGTAAELLPRLLAP